MDTANFYLLIAALALLAIVLLVLLKPRNKSTEGYPAATDAAYAALGDAIVAERADWQRQLDEATPKPPAFLAGISCDFTDGAMNAMVSKYAGAPMLRTFESEGWTTPNVPSAALCVHASWKPALANVTADKARAAITKLPSGSVATIWHETDVKYRDNPAGLPGTLAETLAAQDAFYDIVHSIRDDVSVATVLSGWSWRPDQGGPDWQKFLGSKLDVLAVDFDGIPPGDKYYDFCDHYLEPVKASAAQLGVPFGIAEFGQKRIATDPDGSKRRAEWADEVSRIQAAGGLWVLLYDFPKEKLSDPADIAYWSGLFTANAAA